MIARDAARELVGRLEIYGGWNPAGAEGLPSREEAYEVLDLLMEALLPGFHGTGPVPEGALGAYVEIRVARAFPLLTKLLARSLGAVGGDVTQAERLAGEFITLLPRIREILEDDLQAAYSGDPAARSVREVILAYPCVEVITTYRLANSLHLLGAPLVPRVWSERAHSRTGCDIHPGATIGKGFFIDHCTGVVIGETAELGDQVKLYQGVGLVARSLAGGQQLAGKKRHPTVGDRVTIYANATIVGGDTVIGSDSTIGGNVWLMHSVAPRSTVLMPDLRPQVKGKDRAQGNWSDWVI
ncbi:MAG: Serine acetyltransferase, plasmid [Fibrobacterota bacterium]|jgi:serine O-acetyltransferase